MSSFCFCLTDFRIEAVVGLYKFLFWFISGLQSWTFAVLGRCSPTLPGVTHSFDSAVSLFGRLINKSDLGGLTIYFTITSSIESSSEKLLFILMQIKLIKNNESAGCALEAVSFTRAAFI